MQESCEEASQDYPEDDRGHKNQIATARNTPHKKTLITEPSQNFDSFQLKMLIKIK